MADPIFKKSSVKQKFNFKEMFGAVPTPEIRAAIGQRIIEVIKERTANNEGIGGRSFQKSKYSDGYAKSLEFKVQGKSKGDVNMELTGDMLGLMDIIEETEQTITIGWDDETQNAKAYNHNTGDTVPKRPFFGLSTREVRDIAKEFKDDVRASVRETREKGPDDFTTRALKFLDQLTRKTKASDDGE